MLKKIFCIGLICILAVGMTGCKKEDTPPVEDDKLEVTKMDAEQIVTMMQESGVPITNIIVYTEETDENELLNRPGGYTSKANFADRRVGQMDATNPVGGSVEVFTSNEDAKARYDYVSAVAKGALAQYMYLYENVLLRIDHALTNAEAAFYETAFVQLQEGKEPDKVTYEPQTTKEKLTYCGYTDITDKMYSKKVDEKTSYIYDFTNQTFRVYDDENNAELQSYNWGTLENYGDAKSIYDSEMEAAKLTEDELN